MGLIEVCRNCDNGKDCFVAAAERFTEALVDRGRLGGDAKGCDMLGEGSENF